MNDPALEDFSKQHLLIQSARSRLVVPYHFPQSIRLTLDQDKLRNQMTDAIIALTGAERGFLALIDPTTDELHLRATHNMGREILQSEDMEVSRIVIQSVIDTNEGVVTTDAQTDPWLAGQQSVVLHSFKSILCAPLHSSGKIIGVIYVENRAQSGIFTSEDLELLNTFATQTANGIKNARQHTNTDQMLARGRARAQLC